MGQKDSKLSSYPDEASHGNVTGPSSQSVPGSQPSSRPTLGHSGSSRLSMLPSRMLSSSSSAANQYHQQLLQQQLHVQAQEQGQKPPYERRETKQEREARRRERERALRAIERERSLKEEHVDGGYLVTLGTYVGPEDFSKSVVRKLQIERKLAPFWRGLQDVDSTWNDYQLIAAARGISIPGPDEKMPPDFLPPQPSTPSNNPGMGHRSVSFAPERSTTPTPLTKSVRAKGKAFVATALKSSSRTVSQNDGINREVNLPVDPFVAGKPLEVFLYRDAMECPICFLSYPPYLNHTRCCDQAICSECFVQIKRADPHYPEHHGDEGHQETPEFLTDTLLISEPAHCPYCQIPDFGVTYDPPPFRRGLVHASSINASTEPSQGHGGNLTVISNQATRRRAQSLAVDAPGVVTTDMVRPDWLMKLETMRLHQARRAAAATALHAATYTTNENAHEHRSILFGFPSRSTRRVTIETPHSQTPGEPTGASNSRVSMVDMRSDAERIEAQLFDEAVRQSIADEEARKQRVAEEEARVKAAQKSSHGEPEPSNSAPVDAMSNSSKGKDVELPNRPAEAGSSSAARMSLHATADGKQPENSNYYYHSNDSHASSTSSMPAGGSESVEKTGVTNIKSTTSAGSSDQAV